MAALTPCNSWQDSLKTQILKRATGPSPFMVIEEVGEIQTPLNKELRQGIFVWHKRIFGKKPQENLKSLTIRQIKELVISIFHQMIPVYVKVELFLLYTVRDKEAFFNDVSYVNSFISNTPLKMASDLKEEVDGLVNTENSSADDFEIVNIEKPALAAKIALLEKWRDNPSLVLPPERFL